MGNVHEIKPSRSDAEEQTHYRKYKPELREDFNKSCGYCDDSDVYAGGVRGFHIDHFAPKSKFPDMHITYTNLVYACPICNIYKGNYWPSELAHEPVIDNNGFVDPCDPLYDDHLERADDGMIVFTSDLGEFIYQKLKLGLRRHQLIWILSKAKHILRRLKAGIDKTPKGSDERDELSEMFISVTTEFLDYAEELEEL